jgi:hypothetical protein
MILDPAPAINCTRNPFTGAEFALNKFSHGLRFRGSVKFPHSAGKSSGFRISLRSSKETLLRRRFSIYFWARLTVPGILRLEIPSHEASSSSYGRARFAVNQIFRVSVRTPCERKSLEEPQHFALKRALCALLICVLFECEIYCRRTEFRVLGPTFAEPYLIFCPGS